jgi:RNA polymerase sigma-70 factor (ECF subfamily)
MFYSVVIPGILPAGVSFTTPRLGKSHHSARSTKARPLATVRSVARWQKWNKDLVRRIDNARQRESVHAHMTAKGPANSQDSDSTSFSDDVRALSMLYEQFRRPIHSYAYRLLGSREDADDITQEVFMRVFMAWDGLQDRDHLSAWLYRIATNLCVDLLRRRKRISWRFLSQHTRDEQHCNNAESLFSPTDSGGIPEIAEREHIQLALANMPEEYVVALLLNTAQGIPYQEVAAFVGISPNAAATRISRAKKMFAEQYQRIVRENAEQRREAWKREVSGRKQER